MKKYCSAIVVVLIMSSFVSAQDFDFEPDIDVKPSYSMIVKVSPQHFFWGGINMTGEYGFYAERQITNKSSLQAGLAFVGKGLMLLSMEADTAINTQSSGLGMKGFRIQGSYRFYLNRKDRNNGLYVAPHLSFASAKMYDKLNSNNFYQIIHTDLSLIAGYRWQFGNFSMETYAGGGLRNKKWVENIGGGAIALSQAEVDEAYVIQGPYVIKLGFLVGFAL